MQAPNFMPGSRLLSAALLGALLVSTTIHAATSTTTLSQAVLARQTQDAERALTAGNHAEAARLFEALAAQTSGTARDHALLRAARSYQLNNNDSKAQSLLPLLSKTLSASDNAARIVIAANSELRNNMPDRALAWLDQITLPIPEEQAGDVMGTRALALFAQGKTVLAVNAAVERERTLKTDAELQQNRQLIWVSLNQALSNKRDLTPPAGANRTTAGWLELARLMSVSYSDPFAFNRAISDWRARYNTHPGNSFANASAPLSIAGKSGNNLVALLLPLSGKQQAAGTAVRDGFMAAALQSGGTRPDILVLDTNEFGASAAYARAIQQGADTIVGPLLKEDVEALAASQQVGVMTLSLNSIDGTPPSLMFQFALDPESEARQIAQRARTDGHSRPIVLVPNNEWGQRVQQAFVAELQQQGAKPADVRSYDPNARDYVALVKQVLGARQPAKADAAQNKRQVAVTRDDFDYVFMAAQSAQAKLLRPALRFVLPDSGIPVYATSDSVNAESNYNTDLNDLRFTDMPWVINRDAESAQLHDGLSVLWGEALRSRSRLYAFGIDAFKLTTWLGGTPTANGTLRGVTGLLAVDHRGKVHRQLDWGTISNGAPMLLPDPALTR